MRILPRQLEFDNDIPTVSGNADYAAEKDLLLAMDAIISQSGIEEIAITSFLELAVFNKAARLFQADKPVVFRLTQKEKVAVQERAMVVLTVRRIEIIWKKRIPLTPSVPEIPIGYQSDLKKNGFVRRKIVGAKPKGGSVFWAAVFAAIPCNRKAMPIATVNAG